MITKEDKAEIAKLDERACLRCGCTDPDACPGGCLWVHYSDVCDRCLSPGELLLYNELCIAFVRAGTAVEMDACVKHFRAFGSYLNSVSAISDARTRPEKQQTKQKDSMKKLKQRNLRKLFPNTAPTSPTPVIPGTLLSPNETYYFDPTLGTAGEWVLLETGATIPTQATHLRPEYDVKAGQKLIEATVVNGTVFLNDVDVTADVGIEPNLTKNPDGSWPRFEVYLQ